MTMTVSSSRRLLNYLPVSGDLNSSITWHAVKCLVLQNETNYFNLLLFKLSVPHGVAKENCLPRNRGELSHKVRHVLLVFHVSCISVLSKAPVMLKYQVL